MLTTRLIALIRVFLKPQIQIKEKALEFLAAKTKQIKTP